jgi:hypothetical protein
VAAVLTNLDGFAKSIAYLHAEDGAVADVSSLETISDSVAVRSRNNA